MTRIEHALRRIVSDLTGRQVAFALVGGLAVSARSEPRFTRDLDFVVAVATDADAESLANSLIQAGYQLLTQLEQEVAGRLAAIRLSPPGESEGPVVDLLFASSGIEPEVVQASELLEVQPGLTVPVASIQHLLALKILARDDERRPQDRADLISLLKESGSEQIDAVKEVLALITDRGFNRRKDLLAAFEQLLAGT